MLNNLIQEVRSTSPRAFLAQMMMAGGWNTTFTLLAPIPENSVLFQLRCEHVIRNELLRSLNAEFRGRHATILCFSFDDDGDMLVSGSVQRPRDRSRDGVHGALLLATQEVECQLGRALVLDVRESRALTPWSSLATAEGPVSASGKTQIYMNREARRLEQLAWDC